MMKLRRTLCFVVAISIVFGCVGMVAAEDMCPAGGTTDLATEQKKEIDTSYAYYDLKPVTNTTGLSFYVNVRSQNGATIVGYAEERTGEGAFFVNYRPGYGILNEYYRPSAQTDNDATKPVYIEGKWRP